MTTLPSPSTAGTHQLMTGDTVCDPAATEPIETLAYRPWVRPAGWSEGYATLSVEDLGGDLHVKVLWNCDGPVRGHPWPPDAYTVFQRGELAEVR